VSGVLRIEMLPAGHGDALLLEYGSEGESYRLLVDGGPASSYQHVSARIAQLPPERRRFELLVMTHVDADHIEGVLKLLNDRAIGAEFGDIWFNGYRHLPKDELGPAQAEMLSAVIEERELAWNASFDGGPVEVDHTRRLQRIELAGGLRVTLLTPGRTELVRLRRSWDREIRRAGFVPGSMRDALALLGQRKRLTPMDSYLGAPALDVARLASAPSDFDSSVTNASSISFLAEYGERKVLLTGDATPPVLTEGVRRLLSERGLDQLRLDAFKIPHHGSRNNLTTGLVRLLPSQHYLFSTDGKYFGHPDDAAVARVAVGAPRGAELVFNYRTEQNELWDAASLHGEHGYRTRFPEGNGAGIAVDL
jgi:beta-lactamase superfamily II metal-dependent hydrolase